MMMKKAGRCFPLQTIHRGVENEICPQKGHFPAKLKRLQLQVSQTPKAKPGLTVNNSI